MLLALPQPAQILRIDSIEFELDWRCQIVFRLIYHLLLGGFEFLKRATLVEELNTRLKKDCRALGLLLLPHVILFDELVEALRLDELPHERIGFAGLRERMLIQPRQVTIKVKDVVRALQTGQNANFIAWSLFALLIVSPVELDVIVHGHEQEVEEELLDT